MLNLIEKFIRLNIKNLQISLSPNSDYYLNFRNFVLNFCESVQNISKLALKFSKSIQKIGKFVLNFLKRMQNISNFALKFSESVQKF